MFTWVLDVDIILQKVDTSYLNYNLNLFFCLKVKSLTNLMANILNFVLAKEHEKEQELSELSFVYFHRVMYNEPSLKNGHSSGLSDID